MPVERIIQQDYLRSARGCPMPECEGWQQVPGRPYIAAARTYSDAAIARTALYDEDGAGCSAWPGLHAIEHWWGQFYVAFPKAAGLCLAVATTYVVANVQRYGTGPYGPSGASEQEVAAVRLLADGSVEPLPVEEALKARPADGGEVFSGIGDSSACLAMSRRWSEGRYWFWRQ
jgi:hypothetical protein